MGEKNRDGNLSCMQYRYDLITINWKLTLQYLFVHVSLFPFLERKKNGD